MPKSETNFVYLKRRITLLNIDSGTKTYVMGR